MVLKNIEKFPRIQKSFPQQILDVLLVPTHFHASIYNIIEATKENPNVIEIQEKNNDDDLEFQVFFNDLIHNDFNTLFKSLPNNSSNIINKYYAAGVPGSFQNRLFPRSSINLVPSSFSLNWLTKVPEEITKQDSPFPYMYVCKIATAII